MIDAGELDRRIDILRADKDDDGLATVDGGFVSVGRRWARKTDVSDGERIRAAQNGQSLTARFLVRRDGLTAQIDGTFRLACEGVTYEVTGTKEARGRGVGIEITTVARS
ncbi:head-tail adaptor protein [Sphingomonas zeae]